MKLAFYHYGVPVISSDDWLPPNRFPIEFLAYEWGISCKLLTDIAVIFGFIPPRLYSPIPLSHWCVTREQAKAIFEELFWNTNIHPRGRYRLNYIYNNYNETGRLVIRIPQEIKNRSYKFAYPNR
jgi:hypothetical protein